MEDCGELIRCFPQVRPYLFLFCHRTEWVAMGSDEVRGCADTGEVHGDGQEVRLRRLLLQLAVQ